MTSPLPPRLRDTRSLVDRVRQDRNNLKQLGVGFVGGRFSPAKPLGSTAQLGDIEDDAGQDAIAFVNTDRQVTSWAGTAAMHLTYLPLDGSEHVFWHPAGCGGIPLTTSDWYRVGQNVTIPAFDGLAAGDMFTCRYAYQLDQEADPIVPTVVGSTAPGTYDPVAHTLTVAIPAGTVAGDLLVLVVRGGTAAGGGEGTTAVNVSDPRLTRVYTASSHVAGVWTGFADGSGVPITVNITEPAGTFAAVAALASIRGANAWGSVSSNELNSAIPTVSGTAAVVASWISYSFVTADLASPAGYTRITSTGIYYMAANLGFWYDPDGLVSPSATNLGEGNVVLALI